MYLHWRCCLDGMRRIYLTIVEYNTYYEKNITTKEKKANHKCIADIFHTGTGCLPGSWFSAPVNVKEYRAGGYDKT